MSEPWEPMLIAPPAAASSHLSDEDLFIARTSGQLKHLADCDWCSRRLDAARAAEAAEAADGDADFEQALRAGQWHDEFERASRQAVLPEQVRSLMTAPASAGDVEPGQIWRLTWRGRHMLVAVIEVADWQVLSAPVTTDISLAEELTLLVEAAQSPLATGLAVWVRSRAAVPLFVFDRPLGTLPPVGSARLTARAALHQLTRAHLTGCAVSSDLPVSSPLSDSDLDRLAMHDALQEQLEWFAAAGAGLVDSDGVLMAARYVPAMKQHQAQTLSDLLRGSGLPLPELAERTGINMGRLVDLARPGSTTKPEELAAIEQVTNGTAATISSDQQLRAMTLVAEVSRPTWRAARQRWTRDNQHDAKPEDPAALVSHLLEQPVAARRIHRESQLADEQKRLRQHWREQVAMILSEYK